MRRMRDATRSRAAVRLRAGLAAWLTLVATAVVAQPEEWVSVAKGDRTEVFVETASLQWSGSWLAVRTRQEFTEPQASAKEGKTFLSARNDYRIDCAERRLAYSEMQAYAQAELQGDVVQKTKIGERNLKWMDAPAGTVFGELLDYACSHAPSAPPVASR
jgi:hypothetical protein